MGDRHILVLWAAALGLITWRELHAPAPDALLPGLPRPWVYAGASVAFAIAGLVGEVNGPFGTALAAAWVIAIYLGYFGSKPASSSATTKQPVGVKA